jgi:nucleotidyltransferase AbiEii toxin of type IV toxin-antitoxin system
MNPTIGLADKVERLHDVLSQAKIPHAFGGAIALAYYATPRATIDIDINVFVSPERYEAIVSILRRAGVEKFPKTSSALRQGQVRAWWGSTPIDLFFSYDAIHEAMKAAVRVVPFGETTIPILSPEHLAVVKAAFDRPKDWIDIEQMLVAVSDLDEGESTRWLNHLVGDDDQRAVRFKALCLELKGRG